MFRVLLDTNLLLLFVVGTTKQSYILKHKNTLSYTIIDYNNLMDFLRISALELLTTPNILTESSNLLNQTHDPIKREINVTFAALIQNASKHPMSESYIPSKKVMELPQFIRLGLSDVASLSYPDTDAILVTADRVLYHEALRHGRKAHYFLREQDAI